MSHSSSPSLSNGRPRSGSSFSSRSSRSSLSSLLEECFDTITALGPETLIYATLSKEYVHACVLQESCPAPVIRRSRVIQLCQKNSINFFNPLSSDCAVSNLIGGTTVGVHVGGTRADARPLFFSPLHVNRKVDWQHQANLFP